MSKITENQCRCCLFLPLMKKYLRSSKSFQEGLTWIEVSKICQKPTKYGQVMFCEAVKVDVPNSKEPSFKNTISSTLSLITVLFEDLFEAITIHRDFSGKKEDPQPSISLLNKTIRLMDMTLTLTSSLMRSMRSKKNCWCCLRVFVSLVTGNSTKNCFLFWWKWTRPYMEIMKMFQANFWTFSFWVVHESVIIWIGKLEPLILCSHSLIKPSLINRNSSSTIVWPNRFNIPCSQCLQCQPFMTNLELDGLESILTITSQIMSKRMK